MASTDLPTPNVTKSLETAEIRVEAGKLNVDSGTKDQIRSLEASIKGQIAGFKASGIYEQVKSEFASNQDSPSGDTDQATPEFLLRNMAFRFDQMRAAETSSEGESLRILASGTLADLAQMKKTLTYVGKLSEREFDAQKLLQEQAALRELEASSALEQELVGGFLEQIKAENTALTSTIKTLRESTQGWSGYGHAIEPSNLVASLGGAFVEGGLATKEVVQLELHMDYQSSQLAAERGVYALLKAMRGSTKNNLAPKTLNEAWAGLAKGSQPDFFVFMGSPEGRLFGRTVIKGLAPTREDKAQYCYDKAMAIHGRLGAEEAEPYFQVIIHEFPDTSLAVSAQKSAMSTGEKTYQTFTKVGDVFLRLDMLALMAASGGAGLAAAKLPQAARVATLLKTYPTLSKVVPGVKVLQAGEGAGLLTKGGLAFGNFAIEVGKFAGAVTVADKVGGPKAAYAVGMLCFFTPGLIHGFEKTAGGHLEHALAKDGPGVLQRLGTYMSEKTGGTEGLRGLLLRGLELEAGAMGVIPNAQLIRKEVGEALRILGLEARAAGERTVTEGTHLAKEVAHHSADHVVKHETIPGAH